MSKRISAIDWIKFVLAGFVVVFHFGLYASPSDTTPAPLFCGGYLAVEAFFFISGFLFMQSLEKYEQTGAYPACPKVVFHRYLGIAYWLIPAVVLDAAIVWCGVEGLSLEEILARFPKLLYEIFPLQMAGFSADYVTGVSWYISALLLSVALFYPLARRNLRSFAREFCPIVAVFLYGILYCKTKNLGIPSEQLFGVVFKGLLRGFADMALGCFLYECIRATKNEIVTGFRRALYTIAATVSAFVCVLIMLFTRLSFYDFVFVPFAFAFLYLSIGQKTVFALFLNHDWSKYIGTTATAVFLVHYPLARYFNEWYFMGDLWAQVGLYFAHVLAAAAIIFAVGSGFRWLVRFCVERKKENDDEKEAL